MTQASSSRRGLRGRAAVFALVIIGLVFTGVLPLRRYMDVRESIAALQQQERAIEQRIEELEERKRLLKTDAEVETLARERLGMVRPGETAFVIVTPTQQADEPLPVATAEGSESSAGTEGIFTRWWDAFSSALRIAR